MISAQDRRDGKSLDSPDQSSHVSFGSFGGWVYYKCPTSDPYVIPAFTMGAWFTQSAGVTYLLTSDQMDIAPTHKRGDTFYAELFMVWDPVAHDIWESNCLDKMLDCSADELGKGQQLKQSWAHSWTSEPRLVSVPYRQLFSAKKTIKLYRI